MFDVIGSIVFTAALFGMGYAVYRKGGVVGLWNRLKGTVHDMLNAFAPAVRGLMLGQYAAGGQLPPRPVRPVIDTARLEQVAAVSLEQIIEAAEWHAEHLDEPLPKVIADLEPETWRHAPGVRPIPVAVDTDDFAERVKAKIESGGKGGVIVLPPDEDATYLNDMLMDGVHPWVDTECIYVPDIRVSGDRPSALCHVRGCEVLAAHCEHVQMPSLVITSKRVKQPPVPSLYANCTHPDAERQNIISMASNRPLKAIVTSCEMCEAIADVREHLDKAAAYLSTATQDDGTVALTAAQHRAVEHQMREADAAKQRLQLLADRRDEQDRNEYAREQMLADHTWPRQMF